MSEHCLRLNEAEQKRVLDTLEYMTKHPETGYKEWLCSAFVEKQFRELVRVHPIITNGGTAVNGIPDVVEIESYVRAKKYDAMKRSNEKVNRALIGAALSIGANVEIIDAPGYAPLSNDPNMITVAGRAAKAEFVPQFASKEDYFAYIEAFYAKGDRIVYDEDSARVTL